jgi:GH43 family beta-xylosidase
MMRLEIVVVVVCAAIAGFGYVSHAAPDPETFVNPILPAPSADPWMVQHNGYYYYAESKDNAISIRKSKRITEIGRDSGIVAWHAPSAGPYADDVWAPELHHIGDRWYLYFAADDGRNENHRMWVVRSAGNDPGGPFETTPRLLATQGWAIDGTVLRQPDGNLFFVWSGWPGSVDGLQGLYIAPMSNPETIAGDRILLTSPTEPWERKAMPICEGPEVLRGGGKTFIVYSASGSWTQWYCLGMIVNDDGNFLNPASWRKIGPVFAGKGSVYGVGHCSFVTSPNGSQEWILYHAKENVADGWEDRSVRAQQFLRDAGGLPLFGSPVDTGVPILMPSDRQSGMPSCRQWKKK